MALSNNIRMCVFASRNSGQQRNIVCSNLKVKLSTSTKTLPFVPRSEEASEQDVSQLTEFVSRAKRLFVLTGAGISTESGIPDYRSEGVGLYATSKNRPVNYADFLNSSEIRQRYWARNYVGWPRFSSFLPNQAHRILSQWENAGKIHWLVTQNVDALHYKAGSSQVTELHGSAHRVVCLSCHSKVPRIAVQAQIKALNPDWHAHSSQMAPDGDISLTPEQVQGFKVPECQRCGGILKPEIVFFGDNVPRTTVNFTFDRLGESDAMLVAGSSVEVYSGFRLANRAAESHIPIAILNIGQTRADKLASLKIRSRCGHTLQRVHDALNLPSS
ncbi:NAD-dependent protein lipoamidase sirtuin-4, mitochondrial-like [Babylonia areolata]|uniref:NAD-dependent protein lipoamidase sirtuin-4, mitochondrial-like n=1 Tax=Babylonia areolata TaxID=304850 RepID=UPI003FD12F3F